MQLGRVIVRPSVRYAGLTRRRRRQAALAALAGCAGAFAVTALGGCGKADRADVESAILTTIYNDRSFFDVVCGFPLVQPIRARVEVVAVDAERLPWLGFGSGSAPGTARIRIRDATRQGVVGTSTCESQIGFSWRRELEPIHDLTRRLGRSRIRFFAEGFRKL